MDYVSPGNYEGNKSPGASNFQMLAQLYGGTGDLRNRQLHSQSKRHLFAGALSHRRAELLRAFHEIDDTVNQGVIQPSWLVMYQNESGSGYEIDLGESYSVQIHIL